MIKELSEEVDFYIWDTAGQEEYNSLTRRYYKGASACILAFSTADRESFNHVLRWKEIVEEEIGEDRCPNRHRCQQQSGIPSRGSRDPEHEQDLVNKPRHESE